MLSYEVCIKILCGSIMLTTAITILGLIIDIQGDN